MQSSSPSQSNGFLLRSGDRGHTAIGWLDSRHSFSFGEYYRPDRMGFRSLRVINEDRVAPGAGFPTHPHRDMEIFSYVVAGRLQHQDSLGNSRILEPGQIQLMSAGSGVRHSEFNPSQDEPVHFLQIWIEPSQSGLEPRYTEWLPGGDLASRPLSLVISPDGADGSAVIGQDARVYRLRLGDAESISLELADGRGLWVQVISGELTAAGIDLRAGDGLAWNQSGQVTFASRSGAAALVFDLA